MRAFAAFVGALLLGFCSAQMAIPEPQDPHTYASPSGRYKLYVNPSSPGGTGRCFASLSNRGKVLWQKKLTDTILRAVVTDKGDVCGYSDDFWPREGHPSHFRIFIYGPDGSMRLSRSFKKHFSQMVDAPAEPYVSKMAAGSDANLFLLSLEDNGERALAFAISTGKEVNSPLGKSLLRAPDNSYTIGAEFIPGTQFLLTNRWHPNYPAASDAIFELQNLEGKVVWSFERKGDYVLDRKLGSRDASTIQGTGAILSVGVRGFEIRTLQDQIRHHFLIDPSSQVREFERHPFAEPQERPVPFPVRQLQPLKSFVLQEPGAPPQPVITGIDEFCVVGPGKFAYVPAASGDLIVFSSSGTILKRLSLASAGKQVWSKIAYLGRGQIVLSTAGQKTDEPTTVWVADLASKRVKLIAKIERSLVKGLSSRGDGRFTLSASIFSDYSIEGFVACMDSSGKELWRVQSEMSDSVAVLKDGFSASVDPVTASVTILDTKGKTSQTIDLAKAWKRKPSYPSEIYATASGGFIVYDYASNPSLLQMDRHGKPVRSFNPPLRGRPGMMMGLADDSGNIWTSDGFNLYRTGSHGQILARIGEREQPKRLRGVSDVVVSPNGTIFAQDDRTQSVHIFDSTGRWKHVVLSNEPISGFGAGMDPAPGNRVRAGRRGKVGRLIDGRGRESAEAHPEPRFGPSGHRRADGSWLRSTITIAYAPNGTFAILDRDHTFAREGGWICFYAPTFKPTAQVQVPAGIGEVGHIAYDGSHVLLLGQGWLYCVDKSGRALWKAAIPSSCGRVYLSQNTISLFGSGNRLIRYRMPG